MSHAVQDEWRANHEVPRFLTLNLITLTHSVVIADLTDEVHPYTISLQLEGVVNCFEYSLPSSVEYEDEYIPKLELTAKSPAWDSPLMTLLTSTTGEDWSL